MQNSSEAAHLLDIQETVIQYAETLEQVTGIDVEIVDDHLRRIAGTGIKCGQLGLSMENEGHIYKGVLERKKSYFIDEPGTHFLCKDCRQKENCNELAELCTPILLGKQAIGVIGLICFDLRQQAHMLDNLKIYQEFVIQIADFISAKVYESMQINVAEQMLDLLNHIIRHVDIGVIVLNQNGCLEQANEEAQKQLAFQSTDQAIKIDIQSTGDSLLDNNEYKLSIDGRVFHVIGKILYFTTRINETVTVVLFNNIKKVQSEIYQLTTVHTCQTLKNILGETEEIQKLKTKIFKLAKASSTVLITGESGTGKELVARAIHSESKRCDCPFVSINCGAIPDTLLESELFGYVKGAFTGADPRGRIGKFEIANKGTIFLDEIGDMPLYLQVKLLRVLQERKICRIGSNQVIDIDVRVIAATNKDLMTLIKENKFREDLYYRLNVIPIHVPALRERRADIKLLVHSLLVKYCQLFNRKMVRVADDALEALMHYRWPGNVRELENTIEFMINMADGEPLLTKEHLPENILRSGQEIIEQKEVGENRILPLKEVEKKCILEALKVYGQDMEGKLLAAQKLGISLATLYRRIDHI